MIFRLLYIAFVCFFMRNRYRRGRGSFMAHNYYRNVNRWRR